MNQHHNDNASTQADPRAEFYKRLLAECEWACRGGSLPAIADAMKHCAEANMPPPPWLIDANATLVSRQMLVRTGRGKFNSRQARWVENQKHYARWDLVNELFDHYEFEDGCRPPMEKVRAEAATRLKRTFAKGGEDAIKYSYELVERHIKQGKVGEFYVTHFKPNGK